MNKEKLIPELRFPSFKKNDDWKDVKLIDVTNKDKKWSFTGGPFGSDLKSSDYVEENKGVRIIQLQNIGDGEFKNDNKIFTSKEKADELLSCNIYPGDIIMSKMGDPVGRACLIPDYHNRYVMSSDGIRIAVDEEKYDKYFIYLVINSKVFRSKVENSSTGSTRKRIGLIDLKKLTLTVPKTIEEQQKIANCLSSLDNLITAETEKLDYLKDHKKGLLQQLFPANGETKPQFRFPEFENDGDWEEKMLGEIVTIKSGISPSKYKLSNEGKYPFVKVEDMNNCTKYQKRSRTYSSEDINIIPKESIIFPKRGAAILLNKVRINTQKILMDTNLMAITPMKAVSLEFLYYKILRYGLFKIADTSTIPQINNKHIIPFPLLLTSIKEQQKIAACLSSSDDLIAAQTEKIESLKKHKKGLMQQLFPSINS